MLITVPVMVLMTFRMRVLILAAYMIAAILPVLALGEGRQQSHAEHVQMMARAGHLADMAVTVESSDLTQQLLCQKHCLFAASALPAPDRVVETLARSSDVVGVVDLLVAWLAIPPPGPPPKIVLI